MGITEKERVNAHVGIARRARVTATLTLTEWMQTIADFNGMCAYCLTRPYTVLEHFSLAEIAGTHVRNCLPACTQCNLRKRNHTGEILSTRFGQDTIERLQQYLVSRTNQPDEPQPDSHRPARGGWSIPPLPLPDPSGPYRLKSLVADELRCSRLTLQRRLNETGIKTYYFKGDRRPFIAVTDVEWLKLLKEQPWLAEEKMPKGIVSEES